MSQPLNSKLILIVVLETFYADIRTVDWEGWKKIDEVEISRGKERSKPREKIVDIEEMVDIGGCNY